MFRFTMSRRFRWLGYFILAGSTLSLASTAVSFAAGAVALPSLIFAVISTVAVYAMLLWAMLAPKGQRGIVAAHTALLRRCKQLTSMYPEVIALDRKTERALFIARTRRLGMRTYRVAVGERDDDDWLYDPNTMRNGYFVTGTFYDSSPGLAGMRKFVEAVARIEGEGEDQGIIVMDEPLIKRGAIREAYARATSHRDLNFASADELRELLTMLDRAELRSFVVE